MTAGMKLIWTVITGASLLGLSSGLRFQFGLPGFHADFSSNFGSGLNFGNGANLRSGANFGSGSSSMTRSVSSGSGTFSSSSSSSQAAQNFPASYFGGFSGFPGASSMVAPSWPWLSADSSVASDASRQQYRLAHKYSKQASTTGADSVHQADGGNGDTAGPNEVESAGVFSSWATFGRNGLSAGAGGGGVTFTLFTRESSNGEHLNARDATSLQSSTFDPKRKTKFIIHGFYSNTRPRSGGALVKDAFLRVADVNVILVDWSGIESGLYPTDVRHVVPAAGAEIAELVNALVKDAGADEDDVHIIGHSLGSHIAGVAGSIALGPKGKGWITGLDPAGPSFEGKDAAHRLDESDAAFVEAVHTNGGVLGIVQPVGHADFYIDGGLNRHADCGPDRFGLCSHCFAFEVYAHAIENPDALSGTRCDSYASFQQGECNSNERTSLGLNPNTSSRGSFYVESGLAPSDILRSGGEGTFSILGQVVRNLRSGGPIPLSWSETVRC